MEFLDYMTIAIILIVIGVNIVFLLWLAALPGKLAVARRHPQADAITVLGWLSLLTLFTTWPVALVWAYVRPANVTLVDSAAKSTTPEPTRQGDRA